VQAPPALPAGSGSWKLATLETSFSYVRERVLVLLDTEPQGGVTLRIFLRIIRLTAEVCASLQPEYIRISAGIAFSAWASIEADMVETRVVECMDIIVGLSDGD
jgi:hypothetical protein